MKEELQKLQLELWFLLQLELWFLSFWNGAEEDGDGQSGVGMRKDRDSDGGKDGKLGRVELGKWNKANKCMIGSQENTRCEMRFELASIVWAKIRIVQTTTYLNKRIVKLFSK